MRRSRDSRRCRDSADQIYDSFTFPSDSPQSLAACAVGGASNASARRRGRLPERADFWTHVDIRVVSGLRRCQRAERLSQGRDFHLIGLIKIQERETALTSRLQSFKQRNC